MHRSAYVLTAVLASCTHTEPFTAPIFPPLGAFSDSAAVQLTFNPGLDYWPTWTADGKGIGYVYSLTLGDVNARCIAILPAAGGTQLWNRCDDRLSQRDSAAMFGAPSIGPSGQLVYVEGTAQVPHVPDVRVKLWLADTGAPFVRTALTSLPTTVGTNTISWIDAITWTDSDAFVALGEDMQLSCGSFCTTASFVFPGLVVVHATLNSAGVALAVIAGTAGAATYSVEGANASIVFATSGSLTMWVVPIAGGTPISAITLPFGETIRSISCRDAKCAVLTDGPPGSAQADGPTVRSLTTLWIVDVAAGQVISSTNYFPQYDLVRVSPRSGDGVIQGGGDLLLLRALVP